MTKLLLHSCCAPCTLIPLKAFLDEGFALSVAFINPNIQPAAEYAHRKSVLADYVKGLGLSVCETPDTLGQRAWEEQAGALGGVYPLVQGDPSYEEHLRAKRMRCAQCYRVRFEETARYAAVQGFTHIATTLTISPYQYTDLIFCELKAAAARYGLEALCIDFKESYAEATSQSRSLGMYRQNYCGCKYSYDEAMLERAARKIIRARNKKAADDAHE
jgi:predicted adenine nucleotide alpha hydrolase (AANH) superfamily ATPase